MSEEINIKFEKEEKPPEEELLKEQKKQILEKMEQEEMEEAPEEIEEKVEEVKEKGITTGALTEIGVILWNSIAVKKGYEPISNEEKEFLKEHTRRLEEKYASRLAVVQYPEVEALISWISVLLPKWVKKQKEQMEGKVVSANAVPIQKEITQGGK